MFQSFLATQKEQYDTLFEGYLQEGVDPTFLVAPFDIVEDNAEDNTENNVEYSVRNSLQSLLSTIMQVPYPWRKITLFNLYVTSRTTYVRLWEEYVNTGVYHDPMEVVRALYATWEHVFRSYQTIDSLPKPLRSIAQATVTAISSTSHIALLALVERTIARLADDEVQP